MMTGCDRNPNDVVAVWPKKTRRISSCCRSETWKQYFDFARIAGIVREPDKVTLEQRLQTQEVKRENRCYQEYITGGMCQRVQTSSHMLLTFPRACTREDVRCLCYAKSKTPFFFSFLFVETSKIFSFPFPFPVALVQKKFFWRFQFCALRTTYVFPRACTRKRPQHVAGSLYTLTHSPCYIFLLLCMYITYVRVIWIYSTVRYCTEFAKTRTEYQWRNGYSWTRGDDNFNVCMYRTVKNL